MFIFRLSAFICGKWSCFSDSGDHGNLRRLRAIPGPPENLVLVFWGGIPAIASTFHQSQKLPLDQP
jgi:hypothetical protein